MALLDKTKESEYLEQFRLAVKDLGQDEPTLRRFLRARDYDIGKAEDMLRKSIKWRQDNDIDNYLSWNINPIVLESFPHDTYGRDYEGRTVYYFPVGSWQVRIMISKGYGEDMLKQILWSMEDIMIKINNSGHEHFSVIIDLDELTYWKVAHYETIQMVLMVFRLFESNYVERLGEAMVVNTPWVLNYVWPLVKPLLTGRTMQKVRFLGSDSTKFIPELLKKMPAKSMSPKLAGLVKESENNNASVQLPELGASPVS